MKARLIHPESGKTLINHLEIADTLWARTRGLLGRDALADGHALLIRPCNSVHTFFMRFPIDLIFTDRSMIVRKTVANVAPGRLIWPVWKAAQVIELKAGFLEKHDIKPGEQLHVDHTLS